MACKELATLLGTGRGASATFEAQASIRLTPSAGAMGQAGGVAAALVCRSGGDVRRVDVADVQRTLLAQGAYLDISL